MLFNIAVEDAIAKTWTGDSKMQTMPMDKVFIVLCADIVWKTGGADAGSSFKQQGADNGLWQSFAGVAGEVGSRKRAATARTSRTRRSAAGDALPTPTKRAAEEALQADRAAYATAFEERETRTGRLVGASGAEVRRAAAPPGRAGQNLQVDYETADADMKNQMKWPRAAGAAVQAWDALAEQVRTGEAAIENAYMTNFHLRRVTSSFLCSASAHDPSNRNSRCGMALGTAGGAAVAQGVAMGGQFIVGGWCIGTVLDNSASRAAIGRKVRSAPSSMAININVGVSGGRRPAAPRVHGRHGAVAQRRHPGGSRGGAQRRLRVAGVPAARLSARKRDSGA